MTISTLEQALSENLKNDGAGRLDKGDEGYLVKVQSGVKNKDEIGNITIHSHNGPIRISDFCAINEESRTRMGFVTKDGLGEATEGLVMALRGANAKESIIEIKERLSILAPTLPQGVTIVPFYDRSELTQKAVEIGRAHV